MEPQYGKISDPSQIPQNIGAWDEFHIPASVSVLRELPSYHLPVAWVHRAYRACLSPAGSDVVWECVRDDMPLGLRLRRNGLIVGTLEGPPPNLYRPHQYIIRMRCRQRFRRRGESVDVQVLIPVASQE